MSTRTLTFVLAIGLLPSLVPAQGQVHVVDAAGGAGAAFTDLPAAVAAAAPGDTVLVGPSAYGSNMISLLQLARQRGVEVVGLPATPDGHIDLEALEANLSPRVRLVALTHVATSSGTIQPAAAVGRIARAHDVPVLLDACFQSVAAALSAEPPGAEAYLPLGVERLAPAPGAGTPAWCHAAARESSGGGSGAGRHSTACRSSAIPSRPPRRAVGSARTSCRPRTAPAGSPDSSYSARSRVRAPPAPGPAWWSAVAAIVSASCVQRTKRVCAVGR